MDQTVNPTTLSQIKKLLALATSPNEFEAALAAAKAQELMFKYHLSLVDLPFNEQLQEKPVSETFDFHRHDKWRRVQWIRVFSA